MANSWIFYWALQKLEYFNRFTTNNRNCKSLKLMVDRVKIHHFEQQIYKKSKTKRLKSRSLTLGATNGTSYIICPHSEIGDIVIQLSIEETWHRIGQDINFVADDFNIRRIDHALIILGNNRQSIQVFVNVPASNSVLIYQRQKHGACWLVNVSSRRLRSWSSIANNLRIFAFIK